MEETGLGIGSACSGDMRDVVKTNSKTLNPGASRGEVLVALLKEKSDFHILQEQGWYRIPVASATIDLAWLNSARRRSSAVCN
jgi:hypothetical protein